jgi:hypothetical protein
MKSVNRNLHTILYQIAGEKHRDFVTIILAWNEILGEINATRAQIVNYEKKTLFVRVPHHIWLSDFILQKPIYLKKLRDTTKIDVKNILFIS